MKKTIERPEVKVMKLQAMNVIATSGGGDETPAKIGIGGLSGGDDVPMSGWQTMV